MQAKRSVWASSVETSPLSSAVDQFVRQYLGVERPKAQSVRPPPATR